MRWRRKANDRASGVFLDGTLSELADFGETGTEGFAKAWEASASADDDSPIFDDPDDKRARRARDLDRRSRRVPVLLGVILLIGIGTAVAWQFELFEKEASISLPEGEEVPQELLSIVAPREYEPGPAQVEPRSVTAAVRAFRSTSTGDPQPVPLPDWGRDVVFAPVFWAGRAHVVVAGSTIGVEGACVVATLAADDLRVVDIAASGACAPTYAATGDRRACAAEGVVLLELWPYDPDGVVDKPSVESLRVRVERNDPESESIESVRGNADVAGDLLGVSAVLRGGPGDAATIEIGGRRFTCELLDRSGVQVQLL